MATEVIDKDIERIEQLGKNEATVSRWCSNTAQPSLEMLVKIASILNVDPREFLNGNNND